MRLAQPQGGSPGVAMHDSSSSAYHALQPVRATPHDRAAWVAKGCSCVTAMLLASDHANFHLKPSNACHRGQH